jgi:hypothetical protein
MSIIKLLSSAEAMAVYLIALMLIIALLGAVVLCALHLIRSNAEAAAAELGESKEDKKRKKAQRSRFSNLARIDLEMEKAEPKSYEIKNLTTICTDFRNFAASKLGLYYDIADIRRFIAGMGISRLVILRGISGTGKTSLAYAAGEFFDNPATIVPIQPMWKERSDLLGYFNEFTKRFNETTLLCKLYEAGYRPDVYITVLDEVNISRIEYYFAEFLSLLEIPDPSKRKLDVVSDSWKTDPIRLENGKLLLPDNMWFIGTANNDDSTFSIADKVYDRAAVIDLDRKCKSFRAPTTPPSRISFHLLMKRFAEAKQTYRLSAGARESIAALDAFLAEEFRVSFGNRIMRQIEDYVPIMIACGGTETGALDDIFARKIFRKLEQLSPVLIRNHVPRLMELLKDRFGEDALPQSMEYLDRLQKSV